MRVVSHTCSNTEIACALGCASMLVGVDADSDFPADVVAPLPKLGRDLELDVAQVAALRPDLVLMDLTRLARIPFSSFGAVGKILYREIRRSHMLALLIDNKFKPIHDRITNPAVAGVTDYPAVAEARAGVRVREAASTPSTAARAARTKTVRNGSRCCRSAAAKAAPATDRASAAPRESATVRAEELKPRSRSVEASSMATPVRG